MSIFKAEPAAITAAITAIIGVLITTGIIDETVGGSLAIAAGAVMLVVRQIVTPNVNLPDGGGG